MADETVFLFVLVIELVIGNFLLSFIPAKMQKNGLSQSTLYQTEPGEKNSLQVQESQANVLLSNFNALNQKVTLANNQLDSMDEKLKSFDNFKANTAVELKALKEIIVELQNKYLTASSKKIKNGKGLSGKDMHKIIFRSKKR